MRWAVTARSRPCGVWRPRSCSRAVLWVAGFDPVVGRRRGALGRPARAGVGGRQRGSVGPAQLDPRHRRLRGRGALLQSGRDEARRQGRMGGVEPALVPVRRLLADLPFARRVPAARGLQSGRAGAFNRSMVWRAAALRDSEASSERVFSASDAAFALRSFPSDAAFSRSARVSADTCSGVIRFIRVSDEIFTTRLLLAAPTEVPAHVGRVASP